MGFPVACVGSIVEGMTSGEHTGHPVPHAPCTLTGTVTEGTPKLLVGGIPVSLEGHRVIEGDCCCGAKASTGALGNQQNKLRVGGLSVQHETDPTKPHNGSAVIIKGNSKLQIT